MVVADIELDRDHTLTLYCEADQTAKVNAMFAEVEALRTELARLTTLRPMSEHQMYAVEDDARRAYFASKAGPRGQQITYWDWLEPWLIRAVEKHHGITEPTPLPELKEKSE
jgi:hypothetical protein